LDTSFSLLIERRLADEKLDVVAIRKRLEITARIQADFSVYRSFSGGQAQQTILGFPFVSSRQWPGS
jgi:hypothetical protein